MKKTLLLLLIINTFCAGYLYKKYTAPCSFGKIVNIDYTYKETEENIYWMDIQNLCNDDIIRMNISEGEYYSYYNIVEDTIQFVYIDNQNYSIIPILKH